MRQYLLSVYGDSEAEAPSDAEMQVLYRQVDDFNQELQERGAWVFAGGLDPAHTARVIDATGESPIVTDGPYAETKEQLGGFWIIEAASDDEARKIAEEASAACAGPVEVRQFQEEPGA